MTAQSAVAAPDSRRAGRGSVFALGALYAALFFAYGAHLPYWPAWLAARGVSPTLLGGVLAAGYLIRVVLLPVIAAWASRHGDVRPTIRLLLGAASAGFAVAALAGDTVAAAVVLTFATSLMLLPLTPLIDSLAVDHARAGRVIYGRVRVVGSVSFIATNLVVGALLSRYGIEVVPWWLVGAALLGLLAAVLVPRAPQLRATPPAVDASPPPAAAGSWMASIPQVLRTPGVVRVLVAAGLVQASHAVYYGLGTVHWQHLGLSAERIGQLWGLAVVAEVVLFARADVVERRWRPEALIIFGGVVGAVRWVVTAFDPPLALLAPLQVLHAASFAATHLGAVGFVARVVSPALAPTAQGIYSALASGLFLGLVTLAAGPLYSVVGGRAYLMAAAVAVIGVLSLLFGRGPRQQVG